MPPIHSQLFADAPVLQLRDVSLSVSDDFSSQREKLARILLDEMNQFAGLLDARGNTLEVNRAALEAAGIQLDDIRHKPFWEARWWLVSRATQDHQRELIRRASQGERIRCDLRIYSQAAGQATIVIDYSLTPIRDQRGQVVFLLAEGRNITEKQRADAEIARKNAELERLLHKIQQLEHVRSDFFANLSHELRTPLALILGPAESMLATSENLSERQRRDVEVVYRNALRLLKHVNDLLELARLDAGKQPVNYAHVDLALRLRTLAADFDSLASEHGIAYVVDATQSLVAEVDRPKFDRILLNLLSNAFKFTPAGGRIRCALERTPGGRVLVSVQDTGPGVEPELRASLFERFRQVERGARECVGTGLGLAIAKELVELHGGTLTVTEAPGGGALFQVELPVRPPIV